MPAKWDLIDEPAIEFFLNQQGCFSKALENLRVNFESIKLSKLTDAKPSTQQIRDLIDHILSIDSWERRVLITEDFPSGISRANYEVDYQIQFLCETCSIRHQISIELGFDNRQAVGSNLLKMDSANKSFKGASISIIVVTNSEGRETGKWDGSVAIDYDYSWAFRKAYKNYFDTPILLLTIY